MPNFETGTAPSNEPILLSGIWLRTTLSGKIEVLAEYEGRWRLVIDTALDNNISHIVEPSGIRWAPLDPVTQDEEKQLR